MRIDFHTHVFPPEIRENRIQYGSSDAAFSLLYRSSKSRMAGAAELIRSMDEQGIDVSVVFGFPWSHAETFQRHNDYIIDAVHRYPDRLIGFGCFDIFHPMAPEEAARCLEQGLSGIGELALYHSGIDTGALTQLDPIMTLCHQKKCPILIHTNEPVGHIYPGKTPVSPAQIYRFAKRYPKNKIVLAHWGGGIFFFNLLKKEVRETLKNIYFDTAASPFLYEPDIYRFAIDLGCGERILFGSDYPLLKPCLYFQEMQKARLSEEHIRKICGDNARHLLGR